MMPPKDVPPSELFLKLLETPPSEVVDFPRKTAEGVPIGKLRIRALGQEHHDQARIDGHRAMKARGLDAEDLRSETIKEVTADTVARELLAIACLQETGLEGPDGSPMYARIFRNAEDLKKLRPDELSVLFNGYLLVQAKYGPYERTMGDDAELNAWIKRLVEGGSEFPLLRKGYPALVQLAFSLAVRAYTLSAILDSLWPSLPDTLRVVLEKYSMGTGFYGELAASSTPTTTENSELTVTTEIAARMTQTLRDE